MFNFQGVGHVNIIVEDIDAASDYYAELFGAEPRQDWRDFRNAGFAKSAGFLTNPEDVHVSIRFMEIPGANLFLELMCYHNQDGSKEITYKKTHDLGGPRHICLRVDNMDAAFAHIKQMDGVQLINPSPEYQAFQIDEPPTSEIHLPSDNERDNIAEKQKICKIIGGIRYFYFLDKYGLQWEFECGHDDIGH